MIGRAFRLTRRDRAFALRALAWLIAATAAVRVIPYGRLDRVISRFRARRSPRAAITPDECRAAVRRAARLWPAPCLPQAIAGYCLLRRDGLDATVRLGARVAGERFDAHAWLEHKGIAIIGADGVDGYARFAKPEARPS